MAKFILSAFADEAAADLEGQIAALKRNGIRYIEPRSIGGAVVDKSDEELRRIAARLRSDGISVYSLGSPIGKYDITEDFEPHLLTFRRALCACRIFGAKNMRVFSFFVPSGSTAEHRDEVIRRMSMLLDMAEAEGITLCHENESGIYGERPEQVRDLLTSLPRLRGIFDAANYIREGANPDDGIAATLPSLGYIHVKDACATDGAIVPCGMGDGHYAKVLDLIDAATDGTVCLTLEPHLCTFEAYGSIDKHELVGRSSFDSRDDAFDFAAKKLKETLTHLGYKEGDDGTWTR